jgi:hypothetical protein
VTTNIIRRFGAPTLHAGSFAEIEDRLFDVFVGRVDQVAPGPRDVERVGRPGRTRESGHARQHVHVVGFQFVPQPFDENGVVCLRRAVVRVVRAADQPRAAAHDDDPAAAARLQERPVVVGQPERAAAVDVYPLPLDSRSSALRAAWRRFGELHDDLLGVAPARGDLDERSASALLGRLIGRIRYVGLQLRGDPAHPTLINAQYTPWNWGHSNPDTLYLSARIDDAHDYRVYGTLGSVAQTTFGICAGKDDQAQAVKTQSEDLDVGADGSFEIYFSRQKAGDTNWFELPPGAESFCCFQTYGDWQRQSKGTIRIECLNAQAPARPPSLAQTVAAFDEHLAASRDLFTMWVNDIPARVFGALPKNVAIPPMQPPSGHGRRVVRPHLLGSRRRPGLGDRLPNPRRHTLCRRPSNPRRRPPP